MSTPTKSIIVSKSLDENLARMRELFNDCGDMVFGMLEPCADFKVCLVYIDNLILRQTIDMQVVAPIMEARHALMSPGDPYEKFRKALKTAEVQDQTDFDKAMMFVMAGDMAVFVDGSDKIAIIATRGFPSRGVPDATTEMTITGTREAFSEVMRVNTVLIRRRIRDTRLKVKQMLIGKRSQTDVVLMYMDDLVRTGLLPQIEHRLKALDVDAIPDIGVLEQLIEESWWSPFPQAETTERPDKAAASIMEGRVVIIADNSPFVLILPATLNCLYQSPDDYYQRFWIMAMLRPLRFAAGLIAVVLPGFYITAAIYHPTLLPSTLMLQLADARQNVPFPAVFEVLLMDAAFELLREAGTRMPRVVMGTLGVVGGLIIGQAAVEAGIVSPVVVIVVAITAISSFAIPSNSLVTGYRTVKYLVAILSAFLGLLGFWAGILIVLIHLAGLKSFGVPYLSPFVSSDAPNTSDLKDAFFRYPARLMRRRPTFARWGQGKRMG